MTGRTCIQERHPGMIAFQFFDRLLDRRTDRQIRRGTTVHCHRLSDVWVGLMQAPADRIQGGDLRCLHDHDMSVLQLSNDGLLRLLTALFDADLACTIQEHQ